MNPEALELKEKGNECMKADKHIEAMLHYTQAIKLEADNPTCYSNRSLAFLKLQQYYFALEDAKTTIRLMPKWTKGYYRKGEIEFIAQHYQDAVESYKAALAIDPEDKSIQAQLAKATELLKVQRKAENRIPLYGIAIGLLMSLVIVLCDQHLTKKSSIPSGGIQLLLVLAFTLLGYVAACIYRWYLTDSRHGNLAPPLELFADNKPTAGYPGDIPVTSKSKPPSSARVRPATARQKRKQAK